MSTWTHVAVTSEAGSVALYLDGVPSGPTAFAMDTVVGGSFVIGRVDDSRVTDGRIDEVSVYDRALSADEIAAIHTAGADGKCAP